MQPLIAIIEDEIDIAELIEIALDKAGYKTKWFETGAAFLKFINAGNMPDLALLDLMLPDMDGLDICKQIRHHKVISHIPVIMVTAKTEETDKIVGLELGADDYVSKPFSSKELVSRVKAQLRRQQQLIPDIMQNTGLSLDAEKYEVTVQGKILPLTITEFKLLQALMKRPGVVFSRDKLLDILWGTEKAVIERTIDVHVKHLRTKLGVYGEHIENVRGIGYKFTV